MNVNVTCSECSKCLDELEEEIDLFNKFISYPMLLNDKIYTYGVCLLNKWCGFSDVKINATIDKKMSNHLSEAIYNDSETNQEYYDRLTKLNRRLLAFVTVTIHSPSFDLSEMNNLITSDIQNLINKLSDNNIILGYYINESVIDRCLDNINPSSDLYKVYSSGTRFGRQQLAKTVVSTGYISDDQNLINTQPIRSDLMSGMSEYEFFMSSPGCRKGLADKADFTPKSGYLERTLCMSLSPMELIEDDCGTEHGIYVESIGPKGKNAVEPLSERCIGRFTAEEVVDPESGDVIIEKNILIDRKKMDKIEAADIDKVKNVKERYIAMKNYRCCL